MLSDKFCSLSPKYGHMQNRSNLFKREDKWFLTHSNMTWNGRQYNYFWPFHKLDRIQYHSCGRREGISNPTLGLQYSTYLIFFLLSTGRRTSCPLVRFWVRYWHCCTVCDNIVTRDWILCKCWTEDRLIFNSGEGGSVTPEAWITRGDLGYVTPQ